MGRWQRAPGHRLQAIGAPPMMEPYFIQGAGGGLFDNTAFGAWSTVGANTALFLPFELDRPYLVTQLYVINGPTVSGNIDVGIYSADGTRLVSNGSVAQTGGGADQIFNITDTLLGRGAFYLAVVLSSGTGELYRYAPTGTDNYRTWGALTQASAFPLPATATFAAPAALGYIPICGLTGRSLI